MSPYQQMPLRSLSETTCGSLLQELQKIWDEIGESDNERDKMLLQLEQECLDVYRRKVENASKYKADLHQALADAEAEAAQLVSALGEHASFVRLEKLKSTLKEQVSMIKPVLDDLRRMKEERAKEFSDIQSQIVQICTEIAGDVQRSSAATPQVDERDLTVKRLGELKSHFQELQREKRLRLQKVDGHVTSIHELSVVMLTDFYNVMSDVHPSLVDSVNGQSKSISNDTLARLAGTAHSLKQEKQQRLQKVLQDLGSTLMELWNLMDIPLVEQKRFDHVTRLISANVDEVSGKGLLAVNVIEQTEAEIQRLSTLKASKMKELVFKKQRELEEIYRGVHMDVDSEAARQILLSLIDSGNVDLSELLTGMDDQIRKAKEQALSRKDILDKVEKWTFASEEENWLDDYEMKEYIAKVIGVFPEEEQVVNVNVNYNAREGRSSVEVDDPRSDRPLKGKTACTKFTRISTNGTHSVVLCEPITGRTHQIRVHLQYTGHPIANDMLYVSEVVAQRSTEGMSADRAAILGGTQHLLASGLPCDDRSSEVEITDSGEDFSIDPMCTNCPNLGPKGYDGNEEALWLHCIRYSGPGWSYECPYPDWTFLS